jgi:Family of unknown function (DUF6510)
MERLDGNAVAGELMEIFGVEMTIATSICGSCGAASTVAELHVYAQAPGTVIRCAGCEQVQMSIVRGRDRLWLNLSGMRTFTVPFD